MVIKSKSTDIVPIQEVVKEQTVKLAVAQVYAGGAPPFGENFGTFYMPYGGDYTSAVGLTPEKLIVPREFHQVLKMVYDFYQRGGMVSTVINRLAEFTVTEIRNGERNTSNEANNYFTAILHAKPSRLMRFLRVMALEYFLSGLVIPRVDWIKAKGADLDPDLRPNKDYYVPQFDLYPPSLVQIQWLGWGQRQYFMKIPASDVNLMKKNGSRIKSQQLRYQSWVSNYPSYVQQIQSTGGDTVELTDVDPILRKEVSISPYPTPFLFPALEPLIFRQQLRRMDFAVASRVINAILLVQEGDKDFPAVAQGDADNTEVSNLTKLEQQIQARAGNPLLMERLFMLFTNHTTKLTWITPDVEAMLSQDKYKQINDELQESLGFTQVLITGESRQAQASEVSTWAIQPQMEEFRSMSMEWITSLYKKAGQMNSFPAQKLPVANYRPIRLQDFVKTAATFAQAFKEGNISRTTRAESVGVDLETEVELMKDEKDLLKGLPAFQPTPYSPPPPMVGQGSPGRPPASTNVPINNRNSGVKPPGQIPTSKIAAELMSDEAVFELLNTVAEQRGIKVTPDMIIDKSAQKVEV